MKRHLYLHIDLSQIPDKTPKTKWRELEKKLAEQAVKQFELEAKTLPFVILKNYLPDAEVLIEFPDEDLTSVCVYLRAMDVVETIDFTIRKD